MYVCTFDMFLRIRGNAPGTRMKSENQGDSRFWEVDLVRGIAVLLMILFHTIFDLNFFGIAPIPPYSGIWRYVGLSSALLFLLLVGASLHISYFRRMGRGENPWIWHYLARSAEIFSLGLLVTVVTYLFVGEGFIVFGILHCIGVSILMAIPFFGRPVWSLVGAIVSLVLGFVAGTVSGPMWALWIGIHPETFSTLDYYPLFPWFGVVLLGLYLGSLLYPNGVRRTVRLPVPSRHLAPVTWMGRHSLAIYLCHQPILLGILALFFPDSIWVLPW